MYRTLLVPLDGSELAEQALPYVREIAEGFRSDVTLLTVCSFGDPLKHVLVEYLERKAEKLRVSNVKVTATCIEGEAASSILDFADKNKIGLVVISTHGKGGISRWSLGSIATKVVQSSHIPVFLVRSSPQAEAAVKLKKIAAALDGSRFAEAIIPHLEAFAKSLGSEIVLLEVLEPIKVPQLGAFEDWGKVERDVFAKLEREAERYLEKRKATLQSKGINVTAKLLQGKPADAILQHVVDAGIDLVALTTHGFSGIAKWAYGSVASRIIEASTKPILLVRPPLPGAGG